MSKTVNNLKSIFKEYGITLNLTDEMLTQFAQFYHFLMDYQKKYNLTRLTTFEEVAVKHFVDCLYVPQLMTLPDRLLDLGTGAGFPGVPIKIAQPHLKIFLAEGVQKKVEFLKALREHLKLQNLDIIGRNVDPKMQYPVNGVITRAVELASATLKNVIHSVQAGGLVILMKTPGIDQEIREAQETMGEFYELVENKDYKLGRSTHERKLLVFKKIKSQTL